MEGVRFREAHWQMNPGDLLFLYTDGVPEATDASMTLFGNDRMLQALSESLEEEMLQSPQAGSAGRGWDYDELHSFLTLVRRHVDEFVGEVPQFDDLTMMCFSYKGTPETEEEK